jgi:phage shock protein PspC (stress-responsive transcriptional regulator)
VPRSTSYYPTPVKPNLVRILLALCAMFTFTVLAYPGFSKA